VRKCARKSARERLRNRVPADILQIYFPGPPRSKSDPRHLMESGSHMSSREATTELRGQEYADACLQAERQTEACVGSEFWCTSLQSSMYFSSFSCGCECICTACADLQLVVLRSSRRCLVLKIPKILQDSPSHQIFESMHRVLNIGKKITICTVCL
jgi:hypothetical protein